MIRNCELLDLNLINDIGKTIKDNFVQYYSLKDLINKEYVNIIVYEEECIKGFIYYEDHIDYIDLMAIAVSESNKGIGYSLLSYLIKISSGKRIILEVRENNEYALKLYKKCGFKEITRRKKYYDGIDAIIMEVNC